MDEQFVPKISDNDVDRRPSRTPMRVVENGRTMMFRMDVLGEGTMEMVVEAHAITGKLNFKGMRLCHSTR